VKATQTSAVRHALAAILIVALTLAGVGRGVAAASDVESAFQPIQGVVVPICHSGGGTSNPLDPSAPVHQGCCDQCALCAPVIFSAAPEVPVVTPVSHEIVCAAIAAWTVRLSRARTPRQSQGPPAA
jgi:hypothetical protein